MAKRRKKAKAKSPYKSKFELTTAGFLRTKGVGFKYEPHRLTYTKEHYYLPDFLLSNGIYIETKGRFTSKDRTKMEAVIKKYPELDIRMCFMRDQYLYKGSNTKYSEWCDARGIKYCIKEIPKEWLK